MLLHLCVAVLLVSTGTFVRKITLASKRIILDESGEVAAKEDVVPAKPAEEPKKETKEYTLCQALYNYNRYRDFCGRPRGKRKEE